MLSKKDIKAHLKVVSGYKNNHNIDAAFINNFLKTVV